jgi:hypothetical protein
MARITPEQLAKPGTELAIQTAAFCALADLANQRPELKPYLDLVQAIPLGGERNQIVASRMRMSGTKKGAWDIMLPFPSGPYHMGWIEVKKPEHQTHKNGGLSDEQIAFGKAMYGHGNFTAVAYSWESIRDNVLYYISLGIPDDTVS